MGLTKIKANHVSGLDLSFLDVYCDKFGIDQLTKDKLALNLARIWVGNDEVYRSPFAKDLSPEVILEKFDLEVFKPNSSLLNDVLTDLELSQKEKFGPRSIALPWKDWKESFYLTYDEKLDSSLTERISTSGLVNNLRPISLSNSAKGLRRSTNSGLPYLKRKGEVLDKAIEDFDINDVGKYAAVLFTRTQESKKIRGVWGFPINLILLENSFYTPLLKLRRTLRWRSALRGPEAISQNITRLIDKSRNNGWLCLSIDISHFDASVKPSQSCRAFSTFSGYFQSKYFDDWKRICHWFNNLEIITPDGVQSGPHGVGSGSNFTNEVDSEIHINVLRDSNAVEDDDVDIQGDDGAVIVHPDKVKSVFNAYKKAGFEVSEQKTYSSSDYFVYLQNLFHVDYRDEDGIIRGIYPIYRALNRLIFQERWARFEDDNILGRDYYSLRAISILENCRYHPLFEDLVRFVVKYDKYSLSYSGKGLVDFVDYVNRTEGSRGDFTNQWGDDLGGINSFATVRLIKKLRT